MRYCVSGRQPYSVMKRADEIKVAYADRDRIMDFVEKILDKIECPKSAEEIGFSKEILPMTIKAAKDIRDKYVLSKLLWDLGILDEFANSL